MSKLSIFREFLTFLKERKKLVLIPLFLLLALLGLILISAQGSVLAPFIYTLF